METARVDIRKLQLLNDRINQCLDALNQVRLTVHGLSHSGAAAAGAPSIGGFGAVDPRFAGFGTPGNIGNVGITGADPRFAFAASQGAPLGGVFGGGAGGGYAPGLSHSPFVSQMAYGAQPGIPGAAQLPIPGWGQPSGLSHSVAETESIYNRPVWADPMTAYKVKETFPFVGYALPPIVALF